MSNYTPNSARLFLMSVLSLDKITARLHAAHTALNAWSRRHTHRITTLVVCLFIGCFITALLMVYMTFLHVKENKRIDTLTRSVQAQIARQHTLDARWQQLTLGKTLWQERMRWELHAPTVNEIEVLFDRTTGVAHAN